MFVAFAIWLQNTPLFTWLREFLRGYEVLLSCHISFIALFGAMIAITDLRLLGIALRNIPVADVINAFRVPKRIGFLLAAACGFLVFGMKAEEYAYNIFFKIKLFLFFLVAVHAFAFRRTIYNQPQSLDRFSTLPGRVKVAAVTSMLLWISIVIAGRGIGYIIPPPLSHHFVSVLTLH